MPYEPSNLAISTKLVVAVSDYFRDVGLHRQLTVKMDSEITNGLQRTVTVVPVSSVRSESVSFSSIWREPNHISSVLAALSCSLRDAHHEVMSLIQRSSV